MAKPITLPDAAERGLLVEYPNGIHTFSNGSEWYSWADVNCDRCRFYDPEAAGALCAFEAASFLHIASPDLARMFGWLESAEYPGHFNPPHECAFLRRKDDRDDDDRPPTPDPDPLQLVLIADPTEIIAGIEPVIDVTVAV
jgi:hypothetical protein